MWILYEIFFFKYSYLWSSSGSFEIISISLCFLEVSGLCLLLSPGFLALTTHITLLTACCLGMANAGAWAYALTAGTDAGVGLTLRSHHTLSITGLLGSSLYSFFVSPFASPYQSSSLSLFLSHVGFGTDNWNSFHLNSSIQTYKFLLSINVHVIFLRWCPLLCTLLPKQCVPMSVQTNYYSHLNWLMWHKNKLSCQTTGRLK